jgi:hypothetical protein
MVILVMKNSGVGEKYFGCLKEERTKKLLYCPMGRNYEYAVHGPDSALKYNQRVGI